MADEKKPSEPFGWPLDRLHRGGVYGGTVTGRFLRDPEPHPLPVVPTTGLEELQRREMMTHVVVNSAVVADYAEIEKRVLAQLSRGMGYGRIGRSGFQHLEEQNAGRMQELYDMAKAAMDTAMANTVAHYVEGLQTRIDEEGCGAVFASLRTWED